MDFVLWERPKKEVHIAYWNEVGLLRWNVNRYSYIDQNSDSSLDLVNP